MRHPFKTNYQIAKENAQRAAKRDIENGKKCDPTRHNARKESAFAEWYTEEYKKRIQWEKS